MPYTLLPYFYTLFREANVTGVPVLRPLWMEFSQDEATFSNDEAFMVGNGLLVQGVYTKVLRALKYSVLLISTYASLPLYLIMEEMIKPVVRFAEYRKRLMKNKYKRLRKSNEKRE